MRGGGCPVEVFHNVDGGDYGWQCFDCDVEESGLLTLVDAETGREKHRVEVATQQLIDEGELP